MEAFLLLQVTIVPRGPTAGQGPFSKGQKKSSTGFREEDGASVAQGLSLPPANCVDPGESPLLSEPQWGPFPPQQAWAPCVGRKVTE